MIDLISKSIKTAAELISKGNLQESELICRQVLKIDEKNSDAMCLLSCCLRRLGKEEESIAYMENAQEIAGESPQLHNSLGISCMHAREIEKAIMHFKRASELDDQDSDGLFNLGLCLIMCGKPKESLVSFREAYARNRSHKIMIGMACAKAEVLDIEGSIDMLNMVLESDPNNSEAKTNIASALHLAGRWDEAWSYYTSRFDHYERLKKIVDNLGIPLWNKGEPPKGRILVFSEQGIGDAINFGRMSLCLQSKYPDREISVFVSPQLRPLMESQGIKTTTNTEGFDVCCSMMDLPGLLKISQQDVKNSFVAMKPQKRCDMSYFGGFFKVGVCWAGNPAHPKDAQRSCSLSNFREISKLQDVKLFSLQKDIRPRMWPNSSTAIDLCEGCNDMRLIDMSPHMNSWEDTAAIISSLDLVISVDTSVMHLSAAMGKETWGILPKIPDWRWGLDSQYSIWYPSLLLFRQKSQETWSDVFSAVCEKLKEKLTDFSTK